MRRASLAIALLAFIPLVLPAALGSCSKEPGATPTTGTSAIPTGLFVAAAPAGALDLAAVRADAQAGRDVLNRDSYPPGARVERELPVLHRLPDGILQGYIDRLVLVEEGSRVVAAEVVDFKTDWIDESDPRALDGRMAYYRPQIDAYRAAVAGRYGLGMDKVTGKLVFLRLGLVREV